MKPAAMRYTECRLDRLGRPNCWPTSTKNTVNFVENFDGTEMQEPAVLPSSMPNLLLNGATGIAVGMATNIPPHNLRELSAAIAYLIDRYDAVDEVGVEELMQFILGPDFPTGGIIVGRDGIKAAYGEGKGRVVVRGVAHVEDMNATRQRIVITELPYMVNKSTLIERIAELVREDRIDAISDLRDESDRRGISVVIELKRGAQARKVHQPALQVHGAAKHVWRADAGVGERRAQVDAAEAGADGLHRAPPRGHCPALAVRARQGPRPRPHPRRPADRAR